MSLSRIAKLPANIANQIAAGEVVERPASVLKELMENSIDAGATQINVTITQGGIDLIQVEDNGCGINQDDLPLAFEQHATSKIKTTKDLAAIYSLGFRGEALASISSVAKCKIISKANNADCAYEYDGNELTPAAHGVGTTVEVKDLFYNIPARRKFLKTQRTEFNHIEEVFKRIALSNFNIGFSLIYNGKEIKKLPICKDDKSRLKRIAQICSKLFLDESIYISVLQNGLKISGWLGLPDAARSHAENQYFYINNRVIRDKLINHAIKQAYSEFMELDKFPFYCLYLELDAKTLDVNVHPTKHEVRFQDARIIHAFIIDAITDSFSKHFDSCCEQEVVLGEPKAYMPTGNNKYNYKAEIKSVPDEEFNVNLAANNILCDIKNRYVIFEVESTVYTLDAIEFTRYKLEQVFTRQLQEYNSLKAKSILMPVNIKLVKNINDYTNKRLLIKYGFEYTESGPSSILIRAVPEILFGYDFNMTDLVLDFLINKVNTDEQVLVLYKALIDSYKISDIASIIPDEYKKSNFIKEFVF